MELEDLNAEAVRLAETIKKNFEELGIWGGILSRNSATMQRYWLR